MSNIHARGVKFQDVKHKIGIVIEVLNKKKGDDNILKTRKKYEMKHVEDQDLDEIQEEALKKITKCIKTSEEIFLMSLSKKLSLLDIL